MWMRGGPCDGAFEVVKKLFNNRVVCRNHESRELHPIADAAFKVEGVPHQHSGAAGHRFQDMSAVDDVPIHAVEGDSTNRPGTYAVHVYRIFPCPPLAPSASGRSKTIGLQSIPGQNRSVGDPRVANNGAITSRFVPGNCRS
ncbi:hypothetical protein CCUG60884_01712 [Mycobacteroides salmoniphilum]|uniref:Uncharacterized protein n=1 Tax=Mycobacteroides salmoniphilum TaxID=404941 RepID=A0A4R8SW33_9MYCO|nr:hypothetical protein CCUG60884_01712 [Mycobacteroides salmoniphilum]